MLSFVTIAIALASFTGSVVAAPTEQVARRAEDFFPFRPFYFPPARAGGGPISATGANGGYNYGGNGANGGSIGISRFPGAGAITANGANGGQNQYGNGANGGRISVGGRAEDAEDDSHFFYPFYRPARPIAKGPITAIGANGGYNYGGSGANGGRISIGKRAEDAEDDSDFFFPYYLPARPAAKGPITAIGANGGYNYRGNGANGGRISIGKRAEDAEDDSDFFFPIYRHARPAAHGPITAKGANGGTNIYGNGANGGRISIGKRAEDAEDDSDFFFPIYRHARPAVHGPITAKGANGGTNINGNGANGGRISIGKRAEDTEDDSDFFWPIYRPAPPAANGPITANGANGGYNYGGSGANGGSISIGY